MTAFPTYWDFAPPPARVMRIEARALLQVEIVRNRLGEVMVQTVHAQVTDTDAALRARGIDPIGPTKMIGETQGMSAQDRLAADVARWNGLDAFEAWKRELAARKLSQSSAPSGASGGPSGPAGGRPCGPAGRGDEPDTPANGVRRKAEGPPAPMRGTDSADALEDSTS